MHIVYPIKSYNAYDSQVSDTSHLRDIQIAPSSAFFVNVIFRYCETKFEICHHHFGYGRSQVTSTLRGNSLSRQMLLALDWRQTYSHNTHDGSLYEPHRIFRHVRNMSHELKAIGEGETEVSVLVVHIIRCGIWAEYPARVWEEGKGQKLTLLPLQGCCYSGWSH